MVTMNPLTAHTSFAYGLGCLAVGTVLTTPVSGTEVTHVSSVSDPVTTGPLETTTSANPELALLLVGVALLVVALLGMTEE